MTDFVDLVILQASAGRLRMRRYRESAQYQIDRAKREKEYLAEKEQEQIKEAKRGCSR